MLTFFCGFGILEAVLEGSLRERRFLKRHCRQPKGWLALGVWDYVFLCLGRLILLEITLLRSAVIWPP
jgi:hypothetical protein